MSMLIIRGTFRAKGLQPDGDTVAFTPDNVADWRLVPGARPILPKADGRAAIRLEAIDALETHYGDDTSGIRHQPLPLAHQAADELLKWLGFTDFHRDDKEFIISTIPETVPGFILTGGADMYGRCVALVGRKNPPAFNGYEIDVDVEQLKKTANHHLVKEGLAYPTYYTGFPDHLRTALTVAALAARNSTPRKGVWAKDATTEGAKVVDMASLTADDGAVILPKLFRRLKDYLDLGLEGAPLACLPAFLAGAGDAYYLQGKADPFTGLQHIVKVSDDGRTVRMTHPVEEITFEEA
ncbi:nuclease [Streptomyces sp. RerS4]|uniref:nuclease n=1 Tax=Streptomyces sp. RerS4 TaxID=2942449 RepID=UPI00201C8E30|nr:nuclease [Streptomyces sp. RerS4]UQX00861.1 nuclease [Streptomyces sp. RerS4]